MGFQIVVDLLCTTTKIFVHDKEENSSLQNSFNNLNMKRYIKLGMHTVGVIFGPPNSWSIYKQVQAFALHFAIMFQCWNLPLSSPHSRSMNKFVENNMNFTSSSSQLSVLILHADSTFFFSANLEVMNSFLVKELTLPTG